MADATQRKKSRVSMMVSGVATSGSIKQTLSQSMSRLRMRKKSFGFGRVSGIRNVERTSQIAMEYKRPPLLYLNTYQLEPKTMFCVHSVTAIVNEVLNNHWDHHIYNDNDSPSKALLIASEVTRKTRMMNFNRYRIISVVTIGQKRAQSYNNAIAFLWDHLRDNYVNEQREETTAFIQKSAWSYNDAIAFLWDHVRDNNVNEQREETIAFKQIVGMYLDQVKLVPCHICVVTIIKKRVQKYDNAIVVLWDHVRTSSMNKEMRTLLLYQSPFFASTLFM